MTNMRQMILSAMVALLLVGSSSMAFGQETVNGHLTDALTGEPLIAVSVIIKGTTQGTTSDINGDFSVEVASFPTTLVFSFIGFKTTEAVVTSNANMVNVSMDEDILGLEEVVVTGLATSVKRTNAANSVGTISERELTAVQSQTVESALSAKVAGVSVSQNTGAPGGGFNVTIRGSSSITGGTQPLYVVDGVVMDNSAIQSGIDIVNAAAGAGSSSPQGQPTNRIADINPNDIANVEILKGASAAAIYGSRASNGVVIITTKRGQAGESSLNITQQVGFTSILRKLGTRKFTAATAEATQAGGADLLAANGQLDYEDLIYGQTGLTSQTAVSMSGGTSRTRYFASGLALQEDGIVENTGYSKYSGRFNLDHKFNDRISLKVGSQFIRSESDRSITGNENRGSTTLGFAQIFTLPFIDLRADADGNYPDGPSGSNPLHTIQVLENNELTNRGILSLDLNINLLRTSNQTLEFITRGGADFYSVANKVYSPETLQFERASGEPGTSVQGETTSFAYNFGGYFVHRFSTASNMNFSSTAGFQIESSNRNNILNEARGLIVGQSNLDQSSSVKVYQTRNIRKLRGFFFQEEVDLDDKVSLAAGIRGDASSLVGDTEKYFLYPKASVALRLSQFGFWDGMRDMIGEFKIRSAFGRTGNAPKFGQKYTSLLAENVAGSGGVGVPGRKGNPDILPETMQEIEFGVDFSGFDDKVSVEFTYYLQTISDLILDVALPPSSGYSAVSTNAGTMETNGIELGLVLTPVRTRSFSWVSRINFTKSASEVTKLDVDPFEMGGFALSLGQFQIQEGVSPNTIVGLDEDGNKVVFGNEKPDFQVGFNNTVEFGDFSFNMLWDWKQGGDIINLGLFLQDLGGTAPDHDTEAAANRRDGVGGTGRYIGDGTYVKLREIALNYSIPSATLNNMLDGQIRSLSIGVSGRNLLMFTDYEGYDPEVSQFGNVAIGSSVDVVPFPSARRFQMSLNFGF